MKTLALTAAALLVAAGSAFAGSDHYGSNFTYSNVDSSYTASVKSDAAQHDLGNTAVKPITDGAPRLGGNS